MKKYLIALLTLCGGLTSCGDTAENIHYHFRNDMMYFIDNVPVDGVIPHLTKTRVKAGNTLEFYVFRNMFDTGKYARQTAEIVVETELSTAVEGVDFTLSDKKLVFPKSDVVELPVTLTTDAAAAGKTVVLRLHYAYRDICPLENRKADILTVSIE